MTHKWLPALVLGFVVVGGLLTWKLTGPTDAVSLAEKDPKPKLGHRGAEGVGAPESAAKSRSTNNERDEENLRGPNGQQLPPGSTLPKAGLPDRGPPHPPANDPEEWRRRRLEAAAKWRAESMAVAGKFATDHQLSIVERENMVTTLAKMHDEFEAVRTSIEAGNTSPADGRDLFDAIRKATMAELVQILGPFRTAELRRTMSVIQGGGF